MRRQMGRWEEEDILHTVYLQLYLELIAYPCLLYVIEAYHPEISETLGLHLSLDISTLSSFSVSKLRLTSESLGLES